MTDQHASAGSAATPNQRFHLSGKVAVVTGGSRGIGRAVAEGLAAAGADVVVASRKLAACEAAASEIAEATGRETLAVGCHVGHWDDCDALIDATYDHFGRCDVLVNNAGMSPLYDDLASVTEQLYDVTHSTGQNVGATSPITSLSGVNRVAVRSPRSRPRRPRARVPDRTTTPIPL